MARKPITEERMWQALENDRPPMSKRMEIAIIQYLGTTGSYFADSFSHEEQEQMIVNIRSDFPLIHKTSVEEAYDIAEKEQERVTELEKEIGEMDFQLNEKDRLIEERDNIISGIFHALVTESCQREREGLEPIRSLEEHFTPKEIIRYKISQGYSLTVSELSYISENL